MHTPGKGCYAKVSRLPSSGSIPLPSAPSPSSQFDPWHIDSSIDKYLFGPIKVTGIDISVEKVIWQNTNVVG